MVQPINKEYEAPKSYTEWPDGEYVAVGIEFTSTDDNGHPILKKQKNGLFARFNFLITNPDNNEQAKGPNHGLALYEFASFARAWDLQFPEPPPEGNAGAVSEFLTTVATTINTSPNTASIIVKDAWVNIIKGMAIKEGFYNFRIVDVASKNEQGQKSWFMKKWPSGDTSQRTRLVVEILTGNQGTPTPYKGTRIFVEVEYGFVYDPKTGAIDWHTTDTGAWSINAKRASMLYNLTAPTMFDPWDAPDATNIIPYWMAHWGNDTTCPLFGKIDANVSKSGVTFYNIKFEDVEECVLPAQMLGINDVPSPVVTPPAPAPVPTAPVQAPQNSPQSEKPGVNIQTDAELDKKARQALFDIMGGADAPAFDAQGNITPVGIEFAKTHLTPLQTAGKIEGVKLAQAGINDVLSILNALGDAETLSAELRTAIKVKHEAVAMSLIGLDNSPVEAEESPW